MDIIHVSLRIPVKRYYVYCAVLLCSSLFLTSCGGGEPGEEEVNSNGSTQSFTTFDSSSNDYSNTVKLLSGETQELSCQQQNSLLCEGFEWSSSLAYKASPVDWSLKGWQFYGMDRSGNFCNVSGFGNSQCALKWVQQNNELLDVIQKASYSYSEYSAGFTKVSLSWAAKWSAQWVWDAESSSHLILESKYINDASYSLLSVDVDSNGFVQLVIHGNKLCGGDKITLESDKSFALQGNNLGQWQQFKLEFNLEDDGKDSGVSLSVNNKEVISLSNMELDCTVGYSTADTVSFSSNSYNKKITTEQNVLIDNILIIYK